MWSLTNTLNYGVDHAGPMLMGLDHVPSLDGAERQTGHIAKHV